MRKILAILFIIFGTLMIVLSIREFQGKKKSIDAFGIEFSFQNKESKRIFYKNTGIGSLMLVSGITIVAISKKKKTKTE